MKLTLITLFASSLLALPSPSNNNVELNRRLIDLGNLSQLVKYAAGNFGIYNSPSTKSTTLNINNANGGSTYSKTETTMVTDVTGKQMPMTTSSNYFTTPPDQNGMTTTYLNGKPISSNVGAPANYGLNYGNGTQGFLQANIADD